MFERTDIPLVAELDWHTRHEQDRQKRLHKAATKKAKGGARETGKGGVHRAVVALVRRAYPQALVTHVENEDFGRLSVAQKAAKIADGMCPGFPDLITVWPGPVTVLLEVKREKGGTTSDKQDDRIAQLRRMGFHVAVVRSVDEATEAFRAAGVIR